MATVRDVTLSYVVFDDFVTCKFVIWHHECSTSTCWKFNV